MSGVGPAELPREATEAIARAEREKDQFLSVVAHELKTPLTPLKSVAQLMRSRFRKVRAGERELDLDALERSLAMVERQVDRMDRLVTDLLEVSRIGRGTFQLQPAPFDLAVTTREVVQKWIEATAEEGRHRISLESPATLTVTGDRARIEQGLHGLIGNAVKFSPRGGAVAVRLSASEREATLTVTDEGIGIPPEELPRLGTDPFVRGKRAQGYAGVGVGLYLVRLVAEGHGGRVEIASEGDDKGTTAQLTLPR